jgi:hypothetical protein
MKIEGKKLIGLSLVLLWSASGWTQEPTPSENPAPVENHIAVPSSGTPTTPAPAAEVNPEAAPAATPPPASVSEPKPPAPEDDFMPSSAEPVEKPKPEEKKIVAPGLVGAAEGEMFIGHRFYEEKGGGWGWVKRPNEGWNQAIWVVLKETPGKIVAPFRRNSGRSADHNYEYKLWGEFNGESAYDPHRDEVMPAFLLKGYQVIGPTEPLTRKPGSPDRFNKQKKSRAGSRNNPVAERLNQAY